MRAGRRKEQFARRAQLSPLALDRSGMCHTEEEAAGGPGPRQCARQGSQRAHPRSRPPPDTNVPTPGVALRAQTACPLVEWPCTPKSRAHSRSRPARPKAVPTCGVALHQEDLALLLVGGRAVRQLARQRALGQHALAPHQLARLLGRLGRLEGLQAGRSPDTALHRRLFKVEVRPSAAAGRRLTDGGKAAVKDGTDVRAVHRVPRGGGEGGGARRARTRSALLLSQGYASLALPAGVLHAGCAPLHAPSTVAQQCKAARPAWPPWPAGCVLACIALPSTTLSVEGSISSASDTSEGDERPGKTGSAPSCPHAAREHAHDLGIRGGVETVRPVRVYCLVAPAEHLQLGGRGSWPALPSRRRPRCRVPAAMGVVRLAQACAPHLTPPRPPLSAALPGCPAASWSGPQTPGWAPAEQNAENEGFCGMPCSSPRLTGRMVCRAGEARQAPEHRLARRSA